MPSSRPWTGSRALATLLGDPQRAFPVIHITGTNGKTSTARMIETLLRARGLRTGLFTSPHLSVDPGADLRRRPAAARRSVRGRLRGDRAVRGSGRRRAAVRLSFFEVLTAMAFAVFADAPGGRGRDRGRPGRHLGRTNVADGAVAVVTPVSIDHTRYLGTTVEEIAAEKAGIIKPGAVAVLAQQPLAAAEVLLRRAVEVGASVPGRA